MTIVLRCSQCHSRLTVPDEAAGGSARCPHCDEVFEVDGNLHKEEAQPDLWSPSANSGELMKQGGTSTSASGLADGRSEKQVSEPAGGGSSPHVDLRRPNPYSPPVDVDWDPARTPVEPGLVDGPAAFELAWGAVLSNLGILVGVHSIAIFVGLAFGFIADQVRESGMNAVALAIQFPIVNAVQWFLLIGLTKATLAAARGQSTGDVDVLFSGGRYYGRVVLYMLGYSVLVFIGLLMFIVPGIYLACRFWPGVHFIVDRDVSVNEAFRMSSEFTAGNIQPTLVVGIYGVLAFAAGILTLYIGLLFTYPLYSMLWSIAYLMLTRQPIAQPRMQATG